LQPGAFGIQYGRSDRNPFGPSCEGGESMSAPASALAGTRERFVIVRLADAAEAVAFLSLVFGLLLLAFPVAFPRIIVNSWERGQLTPLMMALTLSLDTALYLRVAIVRSARPRVGAAVCLGSLPLLVVGGLIPLLRGAVARALSENLPHLQARVGEEILAHTYLGLVLGIFLPFLVIRLLQQFKSSSS
jgi:hypothetical protein